MYWYDFVLSTKRLLDNIWRKDPVTKIRPIDKTKLDIISFFWYVTNDSNTFFNIYKKFFYIIHKVILTYKISMPRNFILYLP